MQPQIAVCPVQPPGREKRRNEALFSDVRPLVKALAQEILEYVEPPYALFGHSTGALCAFETTRELRQIGGPPPAHLFVSGRRAPQIPMPHHDLMAMSLPELADFLRRLGGTPEDVLIDLGLLGALQPVLAADFAVNERYEYAPEPPLDIPITAIAGVLDIDADVPLTGPWAAQTKARFVLETLSGGHFAIFEQAETVLRRVAADLGYAEGKGE